MLFEAIIIYLACWTSKTEKLLSTLYSDSYTSNRNSNFIVKGKNAYRITQNRIKLLQKNGIPITIERIDKNNFKKGSMVKIDKKKILFDFLEEINYNGFIEEHQKCFREVIKAAIPHLDFQIDYYLQCREFLNSELETHIKSMVEKMKNQKKLIKYFPLMLSFNPLIEEKREIVQRNVEGLDFGELLERSQELMLSQRITAYFVYQIDLVDKIIENFSVFDSYWNYWTPTRDPFEEM